MFFQKSLFAFDVALRIWRPSIFHVRPKKLPYPLSTSTKIRNKVDLKRFRFLDRFSHRILHHFASILEANLKPCWPLNRPKKLPRCVQERSWRRLEGVLVPCWSQECPRVAQKPSRPRVWTLQTSILDSPDFVFGELFNESLRMFSIHLWIALEQFPISFSFIMVSVSRCLDSYNLQSPC